MRNGMYCIAIMCVGSGVGQSVITSCNLSKLSIKTIGLGINPFAFGGYECDEMDYVPTIYSNDYIHELINKCKKYAVDIIIPGLDDDALILSQNIEKLTEEGIKVIVSRKELIELTRDKVKMCERLTPIADIFVKSYNLFDIDSWIDQVKFPLIAKPRGGSGSNGIEILLNTEDLNRLSDHHIIQELAIPKQGDPFRETYLNQISKRINSQHSEISIQVVTNKEGKMIGKMASYNKLKNGVPIEILPYDDDYIWSEINKLLPTLRDLGHRGPLNIQARLTDHGLKIFEMNPRFSGNSGLRAMLGFNEVESCIKDWLEIQSPIDSLKLNYSKFGVRQTTDKAISLENNLKIKQLSKQIHEQSLNLKKSILITGANGFLAQALIKRLSSENYNILAFSRKKDKIKSFYRENDNVSCYDNNDLLNGNLQLGQIDYLIHCGFARPHFTNEQIANSLYFTNKLIRSAIEHQIPAVINISSQSVYGTKQLPKWSENTSVIPETVYAQAKYATELMVKNVHLINKHTFGTSLRLSALSGGLKGLVPVEMITKLINQVLNNETVEILGGEQKIERLDVRDAADAITALIKTDSRNWKSVYNLGTGHSHSILEIVNMVANVAESKYGLKVDFKINPESRKSSFGMDSSQFFELTGWKPQYSLEDIIESLFEHLKP
ncbi:NAD-dependent epimerase/dehydratase family protein [Chengkuizengella sediminis]|uniref:NAD-dependent epimerase/dehydratase family protein n=1 Tax=Chengkuizengella sediminis TaxID=1885917 RepID=UPI00138A30B4|nr:NAD-dependent epimerase/dehydratase family protein [Chengkuizengella sediminis]NDI33915.1 NAD-dependent epimerase/dehydratase family protein [Chengkuizengella sediminis]